MTSVNSDYQQKVNELEEQLELEKNERTAFHSSERQKYDAHMKELEKRKLKAEKEKKEADYELDTFLAEL